jgi:predicted transglutaminase-like cysteine proteinase
MFAPPAGNAESACRNAGGDAAILNGALGFNCTGPCPRLLQSALLLPIKYNRTMFAPIVPTFGLGATLTPLRSEARLRWRQRWLSLVLCALAVGVALAASAGLGFSSSVTPGLIARYAAEFGPDAKLRIDAWQRFIRLMKAKQAQHPGNDLELLGPVNAFFNHLPFVSDQAHWEVEDYWATPAEMVASDGGDCEDFAIAKYFALKELGVPNRRLRITYVKAVSLNQAHMVLAYYPQANAEPLILDNLVDAVKPASQRPDLIPVYSFNDEGLLVVRGGRRGVNAGSALQVRMWRGLLDKLEQERRY